MRGAALLDVNFADAEVACQTIRLDQRRVSFTERYDAFGIEFGQNDFLPRPDSARAAAPGIKEVFPFGGGQNTRYRHPQ